MHNFFLSAIVQFISYIVLTINFRAIANTQYLFAASTAMLAAFLSYTIVRRVIKDETWSTVCGMMVGGACGDVCGIYLTRHWG